MKGPNKKVGSTIALSKCSMKTLSDMKQPLVAEVRFATLAEFDKCKR